MSDHTPYPRVVAADSPAQVTVTAPAVHRCPFVDEDDRGNVTITFDVGSATIELHSLREWLDSLDQWVVTHEEYTAAVAATIRDLGLRVQSVESCWDTAGMKVTVRA